MPEHIYWTRSPFKGRMAVYNRENEYADLAPKLKTLRTIRRRMTMKRYMKMHMPWIEKESQNPYKLPVVELAERKEAA
jgi:hypothetical protein